jgi:alpha-1,2-mannosyltransferase
VSFVDDDFISAVNNVSAYGVVIKLRWLGLPGMSHGIATGLAWLYTLIPLFAALRARCAGAEPLAQAQVWLALLNLAALRSPNAPGVYVLGPSLWLLTLLAAEARRRGSWIVGIVACWVLFLGLPPVPWRQLLLLVSLLPTAACIGLNLWAVLRVSRCTQSVPASGRLQAGLAGAVVLS